MTDDDATSEKLIEQMCASCGRAPDEIPEYAPSYTGSKRPPDDYVQHESSYNHDNGHFLCPPCYEDAGRPTAPEGWVAP